MCKINGDVVFTFTQPVMLQSFINDFSLPKRVSNTSVMPGKTLKKATEEAVDPPEETKYSRKSVGKFIHMMIYSCP